MEVKWIGYASADTGFPQDIYWKALKIINGIRFTHREIDIIACILGGRSSKKIASFLSIASKTVENHIHNILLKLECNSRENIIDFIEKSDKFTLIKKHYLNLLTQASFELELKRISALATQKISSCLIVYYEEQKDKGPLIFQLEKHLKFAGIKTVVKMKEEYKDISYFTDKIEFQNVDCIVYSLPRKILEQVRTDDCASNLEISNLIENKNLMRVVFILLDGSVSTVVLKKYLHNSEFIDVLKQENYYFLVFEILKILLPTVFLDKNILEFVKQYETLHNVSFFETETQEKKIPPKEKLNRALKNMSKKENMILLGVVLFLISACVLFLKFNESECQVNKKQAMRFSTSKQPSLVISEPSSLAAQTEAGQLVTWNLPRQDHVFVGRKVLLEKLHAQSPFSKSSKQVSVADNKLIVNVCTGLGGIGKTQLALQYIYHTKHPYSLKIWFPAENTEQLRQKYIDFAKTIGYVEKNPLIETVIIYIKTWLKKHPGWLLVYDNVNSYTDIELFLPEEGGHIILTTRNRHWPNTFEMIPIDVMDEEESITLIKSLIQRNIEEKEKASVRKLVKIIGYLPLALAQAGAYLHQTQMLIPEYLELYENHEQILLADSSLPEGTNSLTVATTWNISLEAIVKEAQTKNHPPIALDLLAACAYMAPEKIPYDLLLTWLKESYPDLSFPDLELVKLISQLWKYCIISKAANDKDISVHRLVQAVIRQQHKQALEKKNFHYPVLTLNWYNTLLKSAHSEFVRKTQVLEEEARQKSLLPHLQILLAHYENLWPNDSERNLIPILNDIGTALLLIGQPKIAKEYHVRALSLLEQYYNKRDLKLVGTLTSLGRVYRRLGNARQAIEFHERALSIVEQHHGKDYVGTAFILDCLGSAYRDLGDAKKALGLHERVVKIKEQHYGKDHFEIACTLDHLGRDYRDLGDFKQAKEIHMHAVKSKEQYYGKDHFEVASSLDFLGRDYRNLGDSKQAVEVHKRSLSIKERYYGSEHIEVAFTLDYLGRALRTLGNAQESLELHKRALKIKENYYSKDHFEIAFTLDAIGNVYRDLGDAQKALELHERVLKIKEQYYGNDHFEVAFTLGFIGKDYTELGNLKQAIKFYERALKIEEEHYGRKHPETAETYRSLGGVYLLLNDVNQSKLYLEQALSIKEQYFGNNHPETIKILIEISNLHKMLGDVRQARAQLERALKIREQYLGQNHPLTIKIKKSIDCL